MKRATVMASIILSLANIHAVAGDAPGAGKGPRKHAANEEKSPSLIRVAPGDWGNTSPIEIEALLNSVAGEMMAHFPGKRPPPIVVSPSTRGPLVMYQKGPSNEYQVLLAARDDHWAEYVYEFSHEFLHILAGYDLRAPTHLAKNQWFEEMLCETASLYMLKRYAFLWNELSPRTDWQGYKPEFQRFTNRALSEEHRRLPANMSFEDWFRENGPALTTKPYLREKNELVAMFFLPLLEQTPDWRAIENLNVGNWEGDPTFYDYLIRWQRRTPPSQQWLVKSAFKLFHFSLPGEAASPTARPAKVTAEAGGASSDEGDEGAAGKAGR